MLDEAKLRGITSTGVPDAGGLRPVLWRFLLRWVVAHHRDDVRQTSLIFRLIAFILRRIVVLSDPDLVHQPDCTERVVSPVFKGMTRRFLLCVDCHGSHL